METFTELKEFVVNPHYQAQRQNCLRNLNIDLIEAPIINHINGFNRLPYCFTLQSCFGHFIYDNHHDVHSLESLPVKDTITQVRYRIAYVTLCIENSISGRRLLEALKRISAIDPENVQLCCAEWFWKRQVNSYVLQVEPDRFKRNDIATFGYKEALYIEKVRNELFVWLDKFLKDTKEI